mmetsp:Transcript_30846/g.71671  ORF Transcript_30846/g.71671 Transcript_30846/m.71671 type:complete len:201 (-) Transcript_30846:229-831(-)
MRRDGLQLLWGHVLERLCLLLHLLGRNTVEHPLHRRVVRSTVWLHWHSWWVRPASSAGGLWGRSAAAAARDGRRRQGRLRRGLDPEPLLHVDEAVVDDLVAWVHLGSLLEIAVRILKLVELDFCLASLEERLSVATAREDFVARVDGRRPLLELQPAIGSVQLQGVEQVRHRLLVFATYNLLVQDTIEDDDTLLVSGDRL